MLRCDLIFRPFLCRSWRDLNLWLADQPGARLPPVRDRDCADQIFTFLCLCLFRDTYGIIMAHGCNYTVGLINVWYGVKRHEAPTLRAAFPAHAGTTSRFPRAVATFGRHYQGDGPLVPLAVNERRASAVAGGGEDGGSWLSVRALFMRLVNWPAADCSGEIAGSLKYTSSSHTARRAPRRAPFHFISIHLRGYSGPALIPLFSSCVSDWIIQYAASHLFTRVFPLHVSAFFFFFSLCESIDASGCNAILNYWDLGNSLILLPSPKHIFFEQNPIEPVGFMNSMNFFFLCVCVCCRAVGSIFFFLSTQLEMLNR